jgi:tRNA dimethylallyltransferase
MSNPKVVISISGPTGIGKTALAIAFAKAYNTEILSNDSRQVFKEMSIGTAVPSPEELASAPHHFIQDRSIQDAYSAATFEREALEKAISLFKTKDVLIVVGGSMLYEKAFLEGLHDLPEIPVDISDEVAEIKRQNGLKGLLKELKALDPAHYSVIDRENPRRVIRALHLIKTTGQTMKTLYSHQRVKRPFSTLRINLTADRDELYQRINTRVDLMHDAGLKEEAMGLYRYKSLVPLQTVGYQEWYEGLKKDMDDKAVLQLIKRNSRRFAKRQLTWYRKIDMHRFDYATHPDEIIGQVAKSIEKLEFN